MSIQFTQYMRPDGRQLPVSIDRSERIERLAAEIQSAGYRFECEHLMTGDVSLTIASANDDVDIEIAANGPDVPHAVDRLVERFHSALLAERNKRSAS